MSLENIPTQHEFFCNGKWTAAMDSMFLSSLIELKSESTGLAPKTNALLPSALQIAQGNVNHHFGTHVTWNDAEERVALYQTCYEIFTKIVNLRETFWDIEQNRVHVDDKVWRRIFQENRLAKAYYKEGEPEFRRLFMIFGSIEIKCEDDPPIINISDDSRSAQEPQQVYVVEADEEDVTSQAAPSGAKHRYAVFNDESTTNCALFHKWPLRNAFPPRPRELHRYKNEDDADSSCASSSPMKCAKNPLN